MRQILRLPLLTTYRWKFFGHDLVECAVSFGESCRHTVAYCEDEADREGQLHSVYEAIHICHDTTMARLVFEQVSSEGVLE